VKRRLEKKLWAYRDGDLSERARARVEQRVDRDPEVASALRDAGVLGDAIRGAWNEGPCAPAPEYLIAALRPELTLIDEELRAPGPLGRAVHALRSALSPMPAAVLAGACGLALLIAVPSLFVPPGSGSVPNTVARYRVLPVIVGESSSETPIYDLAQGESPLMILEGEDGSTLIWILDEPDQVSGVSGKGWA
jgi:anti-sigma factor RsiW